MEPIPNGLLPDAGVWLLEACFCSAHPKAKRMCQTRQFAKSAVRPPDEVVAGATAPCAMVGEGEAKTSRCTFRNVNPC